MRRPMRQGALSNVVESASQPSFPHDQGLELVEHVSGELAEKYDWPSKETNHSHDCMDICYGPFQFGVAETETNVLLSDDLNH